MAVPRGPPPSSSKRSAPGIPEAEPDEIIGDFRRSKEIGKGSFATVYLAKHVKKKSYAAVKVVQLSKLSKKLRDNLTLEIEILKHLKHPHIVQLFNCSSTSLHMYLVMEYCQLSDLAQFMKKRHTLPTFPETADIFAKYPNPEFGGLNEVLVRHFLKQIVSALQYLRASNMIHRDIKPQNLLLNPAPLYMSKQAAENVPLAASENSLIPAVGIMSLPMLKIADFGFARHLPSTSMAETLCGSPLYMAPEILRYEKYDAKADLWSTGTVLHEMVVGKPPFRAQNHVDLLRKIEKANDVIVFDNKNMVISRGMKDLIRKLLKKTPIERITYEDLFEDPVVAGEIPNLDPEDIKQTRLPAPEAAELSSKTIQAGETRTFGEPTPHPGRSHDEVPRRPSPKPSEGDMQQLKEQRRKSSSGSQNPPEETGTGLRRQTSQRDQREQRRPSIIAHMTAPGRQELHQQQVPLVAGARMERRPSRSSPLSGPPLVREPTLETDKNQDAHAAREAREKTAQDLMFEKEYVVIEKRAVEVNAFADELDAHPHLQGRGASNQRGAMVRHATTQGQPTSTTGPQPPNPSRAMQMVTGRTHQRAGSFERRYAPSPQSATNMLSKALNAANARLMGALGTSPPFGTGLSPPRGYGAFPTYPAPQAPLAIGDGSDTKLPLDEDGKIVRVMEEAAHRSNVIYGFAEVKYHQLLPATPSAQDPLGIQQIGASEGHNSLGSKDEDEDRDVTNIAIVGVAEEALVLYVKALATLTKTIDLAGYWWNKHNLNKDAGDGGEASPIAPNIGSRIINIVRWARERFNECLEKSEIVGRRLQQAQRQLPEDHPGHPANHSPAVSSTSGGIATSAEQIRITSGITAERLMFDRAVEMSRAAAVSELVGEDLVDCELGYRTAIMLWEGVLENDDESLLVAMRRMSKDKKDKEKAGEDSGDSGAGTAINGLEEADRTTVTKLIDGTKTRLYALRKKIYLAQQQQQERQTKRSSLSGSSTPKPSVPAGVSPTSAALPVMAGTSPR